MLLKLAVLSMFPSFCFSAFRRLELAEVKEKENTTEYTLVIRKEPVDV